MEDAMGGFVGSRRLKVACFVLLTATGVTGVWIRSLSIVDLVAFPFHQQQQVLLIEDGCIVWTHIWWRVDHTVWYYGSATAGKNAGAHLRWEPFPFDAFFSHDFQPHRIGDGDWSIPLSFIIVPLIVLCACLILWPGKRRPRSSQIYDCTWWNFGDGRRAG
jgi:hypothetical protein